MSTMIASPWVVYYRKVEALFGRDRHVRVVMDDDPPALRILVDGELKAKAISEILPTEMRFGNVTMPISVMPSNTELGMAELLINAFDGNDAFVDVVSIDDPNEFQATYAVFRPEAVQYPNDDIGSLCGVATTTYEALAKELIETDAFICSDRMVRPDDADDGGFIAF